MVIEMVPLEAITRNCTDRFIVVCHKFSIEVVRMWTERICRHLLLVIWREGEGDSVSETGVQAGSRPSSPPPSRVRERSLLFSHGRHHPATRYTVPAEHNNAHYYLFSSPLAALQIISVSSKAKRQSSSIKGRAHSLPLCQSAFESHQQHRKYSLPRGLFASPRPNSFLLFLLVISSSAHYIRFFLSYLKRLPDPATLRTLRVLFFQRVSCCILSPLVSFSSPAPHFTQAAVSEYFIKLSLVVGLRLVPGDRPDSRQGALKFSLLIAAAPRKASHVTLLRYSFM